MIVCNGVPFIKPQLDNIYNHVDEIIIVEGADDIFSKVIESRRSTDDTIEIINNYNDYDNKITLICEEYENKNMMVKIGSQCCSGDYIYQVDVDEFQPSEAIELAFEGLNTVDSIKVPQRWYYKWQDVCMLSNRENGISEVPTRFWRNKTKVGLYPSHIPWAGYRNILDDKWSTCRSDHLSFKDYGRHYLLLYEFQLVNKFKYYQLRDNVSLDAINKKIKEWQSITREQVEKGGHIVKSHKNRELVVESQAMLYDFESFL